MYDCVKGNAISLMESMEHSPWEGDRKVEFHPTTSHEGTEGE